MSVRREERGAGSAEEAKRPERAGWIVSILFFAAVAAILIFTPGALNLSGLSHLAFKTPDFAPFFAKSTLVQFHVATVALALVIGPIQFVLPKGGPWHRILGWTWVAAMGSTAIATLFIRDMRDGAFSGIHLFSVMALVGLPLAIWAIRRGSRMGHARAMIGLYVGLVIAGVTAIAPGRLIWDMFFR